MADKYVGDLTTATPNLTDKLLGVNGSDAYQALVSDVAKKIIEDYAGTTLMGTAQSVQAAFNGSNSLVSANNVVGANNRQGWTALTSGQDLDTITTPGVYYATNQVAQTLVNSPYYYGFKMVVEINNGYNAYIRQMAYLSGIAQGASYKGVAAESIMWRKTVNTGGAWSEWIDQPQHSEVNAIANQGAKNLLPNTALTQEVNGITWTKNVDGSWTANGTATGTSSVVVDTGYNSTYSNGNTLRLTGCPSGGGSSTYRLYVQRTGNTSIGYDDGNGVTITPSSSNTHRTLMTIHSGVTADNLTFYPMIRDASIQDDTYVPYGMSNAELTDKVRSKTATMTATIGTQTVTAIANYKGGAVTLRFSTTFTSGTPFAEVTSGTTLLTLPAGFRPLNAYSMPIVIATGSTSATAIYESAYVNVNTDGTVKIYGNISKIQGANLVIGTLTFVTA